MKKILVMFIALSMAIALLAGCGSSDQGKRSVGTAAVASETVKANAPAPKADAGAKTSDGKYHIIVLDAETEEPVTGVKVQFCSDSACMMGKTDEKGNAVFDEAPGKYTAHILKAPEGYEKNSEEIELTEDVRTATFKLNKVK